jgi:hypothetical protein
MHKTALEEATLTQDANTQEPPPEEAPEQEATVLIPTEPDVIEGEVIVIEQQAPSEDHRAPKQKPYWLLILFTVLACLLFLAGTYLLPLFTPTATITIIPIERSLTTTIATQVQARQIAPLTLSQSATIPATGKRQQPATRAAGTITFYNGLLTSQTIAAGTVLTGSDGVQVVTDQPAHIPAANPPIGGNITVSAHAITTGAQGNIPAYDINQACCATSVDAKNTRGFTGGAPARDFIIVTKHDLETAIEAIKTTVLKSEQAALTAQLHPGEVLTAPPCKPVVSSDHKPGSEATQVTVTVSATCSGIAYFAHDVYMNATQIITKNTANQLGTGYSPVGDIQIAIVRATVPSTRQDKARIIVQATGTWA